MSLMMNYEGKTIEIDDSERVACEVWSRVMGYYRPVSDWNIGKQAEFDERRFWHENEIGKISEDFVQKLHKLKKVS